MSSFFQKTNSLIIKLLNKGLLERMVSAFLALQFPPSPLSLRFAARMLIRSGLMEKLFWLLLFSGFKKSNTLFRFCKIWIRFIKNKDTLFRIVINILYFGTTKAKSLCHYYFPHKACAGLAVKQKQVVVL